MEIKITTTPNKYTLTFPSGTFIQVDNQSEMIEIISKILSYYQKQNHRMEFELLQDIQNIKMGVMA